MRLINIIPFTYCEMKCLHCFLSKKELDDTSLMSIEDVKKYLDILISKLTYPGTLFANSIELSVWGGEWLDLPDNKYLTKLLLFLNKYKEERRINGDKLLTIYIGSNLNKDATSFLKTLKSCMDICNNLNIQLGTSLYHNTDVEVWHRNMQMYRNMTSLSKRVSVNVMVTDRNSEVVHKKWDTYLDYLRHTYIYDPELMPVGAMEYIPAGRSVNNPVYTSLHTFCDNLLSTVRVVEFSLGIRPLTYEKAIKFYFDKYHTNDMNRTFYIKREGVFVKEVKGGVEGFVDVSNENLLDNKFISRYFDEFSCEYDLLYKVIKDHIISTSSISTMNENFCSLQLSSDSETSVVITKDTVFSFTTEQLRDLMVEMMTCKTEYDFSSLQAQQLKVFCVMLMYMMVYLSTLNKNSENLIHRVNKILRDLARVDTVLSLDNNFRDIDIPILQFELIYSSFLDTKVSYIPHIYFAELCRIYGSLNGTDLDSFITEPTLKKTWELINRSIKDTWTLIQEIEEE